MLPAGHMQLAGRKQVLSLLLKNPILMKAPVPPSSYGPGGRKAFCIFPA